MLDETKLYMNPCTGSVASGKEWNSDFAESEQTWEDWGGDNLLEVKKNNAGEWEEVK